MKKESENRICKNKKCQKPLPEGYHHRYCESCRNHQANTAKKILKTAGAALGIAASVALAVVKQRKKLI